MDRSGHVLTNASQNAVPGAIRQLDTHENTPAGKADPTVRRIGAAACQS